MDLHYSQTCDSFLVAPPLFESPMDLHYSQTKRVQSDIKSGLNPLWIYTTLKHMLMTTQQTYRLNPLWIYTTLKLI